MGDDHLDRAAALSRANRDKRDGRHHEGCVVTGTGTRPVTRTTVPGPLSEHQGQCSTTSRVALPFKGWGPSARSINM